MLHFVSRWARLAIGDTVRNSTLPTVEKKAPGGRFFRMLNAYFARQEPGKNFSAVVPGPQIQELMVLPAAGGLQAAKVLTAASQGAILTVPPATKVLPLATLLIFAEVTVISASPETGAVLLATPEVEILATYLDVATELSQPKPSVPVGSDVPVWNTSVMDVRHCEPANTTSDIFARTV